MLENEITQRWSQLDISIIQRENQVLSVALSCTNPHSRAHMWRQIHKSLYCFHKVPRKKTVYCWPHLLSHDCKLLLGAESLHLKEDKCSPHPHFGGQLNLFDSCPSAVRWCTVFIGLRDYSTFLFGDAEAACEAGFPYFQAPDKQRPPKIKQISLFAAVPSISFFQRRLRAKQVYYLLNGTAQADVGKRPNTL